MTLDNNKNIIKHSSTIQSSGVASELERKIWNVLLLNAFEDQLKTRDTFSVIFGNANYFIFIQYLQYKHIVLNITKVSHKRYNIRAMQSLLYPVNYRHTLYTI